MYSRNYKLRKTWFDKYLKNPLPEDTSTSDNLVALKYC